MSKIFCSNCGTSQNSEFKFCVVCGRSFQEEEPVTVHPPPIREDTFFCPKCNNENSLDNYKCNSCREDFSKYNIRSHFSQTTKSQTERVKDYTRRTIDEIKPIAPVRNISKILYSVLAVAVVSGIAFAIWFIVTFLNQA